MVFHHGQEKAAETSFGRAIEIAERQGSKSFQLRAACDLARLYAAHSDRAEALAILQPTYVGSPKASIPPT